jgi:hypothetical protein
MNCEIAQETSKKFTWAWVWLWCKSKDGIMHSQRENGIANRASSVACWTEDVRVIVAMIEPAG